MSASLLVAIPFALLAIVLLFCFVGCHIVFDLDDIRPGFTRYTEMILAEPTLIAYWPLGEAAGETTAVDVKPPGPGHNGTYLNQTLPDDPSFPSAAAPGTLILGQPGIVAGDTVPPHDASSARTTCIEVNGGYVSVPFDAALNPTKADGFTIEAWVKVGWSAADTAATRIIMASSDSVGLRGYALLASPLNIWEGAVGTGSSITFASGSEVIFDATTHLVLTYEMDPMDPMVFRLRLFVDGEQKTTVQTDYQPATQSRLLIGVGGTDLPEPRGPWVGKIQCVALYTGALSPKRVAEHKAFGEGQDMS